jgi:transcriptional regulator with XRE-family HTH domain
MNPNDAKQLGDVLREQRETIGLSAHEVARRAGVNVGTVTRIELGQIPNPRPDSLTAIGDVLGIAAADLFALTEWLPKGELPSFTPYLRAKYGDLPDEALDEVNAFFTRLRSQHGLHGPVDGEDEH